MNNEPNADLTMALVKTTMEEPLKRTLERLKTHDSIKSDRAAVIILDTLILKLDHRTHLEINKQAQKRFMNV